MENINKLFSKTEQEALNVNSAENHMQGLYFDLLSCIGGGDHPALPHGYKMKPMTGFLDIVEAFNDVAKLNSAGSGIVCEVGSKDFVEDQIVNSDSGETLMTRNSGSAQSTNTESLQSLLHAINDDMRQSSAYSNDGTDANVMNYEVGGIKPCSLEGLGEQNKSQREYCPQKVNLNFVNELAGKENNFVAVQNEPKNEDANEQRGKKEIVNEGKEDLKEESRYDIESGMFDANIVNPSYIEKVDSTSTLPESGPTLLNPTHQEINAMEMQMQKYSKELEEIERMLQEQLIFPTFLQQQTPEATLPNTFETRESEGNRHASSACNSFVQTLADGLMSPTSALEMMYDMDSNESPCNLQSPSHYQSCTSFASYSNQPSIAGGFPSLNLDTIRRTSSIYSECLGFDENGNHAQLSKPTLDSTKPSNISEPVPIRAEYAVENNHSVCEFKDCEDGDLFLLEIAKMHAAMASTSGNNASYHSVNDGEDSDLQEFADAEDLGRNQKKKKTRFSDEKSPDSSEDEHLWTSASASEYEDVDDGVAKS